MQSKTRESSSPATYSIYKHTGSRSGPHAAERGGSRVLFRKLVTETTFMNAKTIYKDDLETSRQVWIEVNDGRITMGQQDLGPACRMISGDDEYEREMTCSLKDVENALMITGEEAVISALSEMFHHADALARFSDFLCGHSIEYTYYSC